MTKSELRESWNLPPRYRKKVVEFGRWGAAMAKVRSKLGTGTLLALTGNRGAGKTQIAARAMVEVTAGLKSAYYETATGILMDFRACFKQSIQSTEREVMDGYVRYQLLVIDEFGKRGASEWEQNLLFSLLDNRYGQNRDTILISNLSEAAFCALMGDSLVRRMNDSGGMIECNWSEQERNK
jgi:DNA replication protein DnaC